MAEATRHEGTVSPSFAGLEDEVIDGRHLAAPSRPVELHWNVGANAIGNGEDGSRQF